MSSIKEFLMASWIILIPFQDSGLQHLPIGILGASPAFIPLALLIMIHLLEWLLVRRPMTISRVLILIAGYVLILSTIYLMVSGTQSHGRNLIAKTFNLSVLTFLFLYPAFFIDYSRIHKLGFYIKTAFFVAIAGVLLNDLMQLDFVRQAGIIHAFETDNWRPRGFTGESSYLSIMIFSLGMLSAHFSPRKMEKMIMIALTIMITVFSASKGGIVTLFLVGTVLAFLRSGIRWWARLALIVIVLVASTYFIDLLQARFTGDIQSGISTATRTGMMITAVCIVVYNPWGVGFSGFLPAVEKYVPMAIDFMDKFVDMPFDFAEIVAYLGAGTDRTISTKTFMFDNLAFFGLPFLILYIVFHYRLLNRIAATTHISLFAAVLFCMIAISAYIPALGMYGIPLVYGVTRYEIDRQKNTGH